MNELFATIHAKFLIAFIGSLSAGLVSYIILDDEKIREKRKKLKGKEKFFFNLGILFSEIFVSVFSGMFLGVPLAIKFGQDTNGVVMFAIIASLIGRKIIASFKSGELGDAIIDGIINRLKSKK